MSGRPRPAARPRAPRRGPLAPWQARRPRRRPGRSPAAGEPCPTCPLPALKGPCPLPAPTPAAGRLRPLKAPRPAAPILSRGGWHCRVGRAEVPQAPLKGPGKCPREYLPPLRGHRYLRGGERREEAASCLLKGQLRPLGAMIRLWASPRMYPWELGGEGWEPSRGPFLTAAPQGRWASSASSALPPHLLHFPFGSQRGWEGVGRASPSGLGSPSLLAPSAQSRGLALHPGIRAPRWGRLQLANFRPACAVWVLGGPGRIPRGL